MTTKRSLKTFESLPNSTVKMEGEERFKRIEKCLHDIRFNRVLSQRLQITNKQLELGTMETLEDLKTMSFKLHGQIGDAMEESRIIYDGRRARMIDFMEKLATPCPFNNQVMFGRDEEIAAIKSELLDKESNASIIVIGGDAGTGKTMLAQWLFDDIQVSEAFERRDWINCNQFKDKLSRWQPSKWHRYYSQLMYMPAFDSLCEILDREHSHGTGLIVFDGLDQEDVRSFRYAVQYMDMRTDNKLCGSSKIIVTTNARSLEPRRPGYAKMAPATFHLLKDLPEEVSWALFESMAFSFEESKQERTWNLESKISLKVLNVGANNPCVINTIASILSTKSSLEEWTHFLEVVWPRLHSSVESITSNLNLVVFKRLPFFVKRWLLYFSLFPMDYKFCVVDFEIWLTTEIEMLFKSPRGVEIIRNAYFPMFIKNQYLTDHYEKDDDTLYYKMQTFSYEFLRYVAKDYNEYQQVVMGIPHVDPETVRHMSFIVNDVSWNVPQWLLEATKLRSLLILGKSCEANVTGIEKMLPNLTRLINLDLTTVNGVDLTRSIGNLKLLRSLRLGTISSNLLPEVIGEMEDLRLLDLEHSNVHILPENFHNLRKLEQLYVNCKLVHQRPASCGELVSLPKSNVFIRGQNDGLGTLVDYNYIDENQVTEHDTIAEVLKDKSLSKISLIWSLPSDGGEDIVIKTLQCPANLESLRVRCVKDLPIPLFLGLVTLEIMDDHECECLPPLSTLPKLKFLMLWNLGGLKKIESIDYEGFDESTSYFPSLESLLLGNLPKLEQNWGFSFKSDQIFPRLLKVQLNNTKLKSMPLSKTIEHIEVNDITDTLLKSIVPKTTIALSFKTLHISAVRGLKSLLIDHTLLESLIIKQCHELTTLAVESPKVRSLELHECSRLKDLSKTFEHLTELENLEVQCCDELDLFNMMLSKSMLNNLRHLKLINLGKIESLPSAFGCLSMLETMSIRWVYNLKELPEWLGRLEGLHQVIVRDCPSLTTIPESLGHLLRKSSVLIVEFRNCRALKKLPKSFFCAPILPRLIIRECPKLERAMRERAEEQGNDTNIENDQ